MPAAEPKPLSAQYLEDQKWINDHYTELRRSYPDQWIAVLKGEVVAAGKDLGLVEQEGQRRAREVSEDQSVYSFIEAGIRIYQTH